MLRDWTRRVLMLAVAAALASLAGCVDINVGPDDEQAGMNRDGDSPVQVVQADRR